MFKNRFIKKLKGSVAVENLVCTPVSMTMTFFSIMFIIFIMDFHLISNSASLLCNQLNMGDAGYNYASKLGPSHYVLWGNNYEVDNTLVNTPNGAYATNVENAFYVKDLNGYKVVPVVSTNTSNDKFERAVNYYTKQICEDGGFTMPYVDFTNFECRVYYDGKERTGFNTKKGQTESGDLIEVSVGYKFAGFIPVNVTSYGFID